MTYSKMWYYILTSEYLISKLDHWDIYLSNKISFLVLMDIKDNTPLKLVTLWENRANKSIKPSLNAALIEYLENNPKTR